MKIEQLLEHHGIARNPFADEDAQTDVVFKEHCISSTHHPGWDKIFGNPADPATSIVFGEKGAGKTAMRLQIVEELVRYNRAHPERRVFIVEYDDFNPYLDRFRDHLSSRRRRSDRMLAEWKLWDHMDAILALAVTRLGNQVLAAAPADAAQAVNPAALDRHQARDLLLLAACYDQSLAEPVKHRWHRLRRKLRFRSWRAHRNLATGVLATLLVAAVIAGTRRWDWLGTPWPYVIVALTWLPWLAKVLRRWRLAHGVTRQLRVLNHETNSLRQILMNFTADELTGQPLPTRERSDDRYELLVKLQTLLKSLGYAGIVVLVDRVDEPHLINGSAEQMKALLWPMLDNKFLKHPGLGFKLLLPIELSYFIERESRDFYQRARLDKQNLVPSLEWTGEALYDIANARLKACAAPGRTPTLRDLFDESISERRLLEAFRGLRVPRHLFKFMYRLLVAHSNKHTEDHPEWRLSSDTFESELAVFQRTQEAFDRGMAAG